ncbi:CDP-alcohol phosphatidyltransferase family protein [Candidatus Nitronereus thalassa]|uniref:CDP-diacylglycerol--glycerol-3-phosphate 3-phosphatidyltransferase n=1 Tax=Candidatus Nitronereus thalassa TaxID=3020898 RepID=A0ABU3K7H4_9BACT|nr:CDP-alcohol phosphatidyltransferase family protein [Candidatus Nitronereus thalassa]MDT7042345.1 CDP-alcohol phosphatidyltransferase family protein [Candidatus Nitronereus thalassa]
MTTPKNTRVWDSAAGNREYSLSIILNIPNSLTILRILLIPVIVGFLVYGHVDYALWTLIFAAITDALDGSIARLANQKTEFGAYLDPLADKLLLMTLFITFSLLDLLPAWSVILVVSRDAILLTGTLLARLTDTAIDYAPSVLGKATTLFQLAYIILVLEFFSRQLNPALLDPLLYTMSILTVGSGLHYIVRSVNTMNAPSGGA